MKMHGQLKEHYNKKGDANVPTQTSVLGTWVTTQRQAYAKGKLSHDRVKLLDNLKLIWDPLEEEWQIKYKLLKQYFEENGHTKVPFKNPDLGIWVFTQRRRRRKENLSIEKVALLDNIDFLWDPQEEEWQKQYLQLRKYFKDNCHVSVPRNHPILGK